jgi:hypothetical protein
MLEQAASPGCYWGDEMGGACSRHGTYEKCLQHFGLKSEERLHGRSRHRWDDIKWVGQVWTGFGWLRMWTGDGLC